MKSYKGQGRQKGFTLIEMILVIGLMAVATMISFYEKKLDMEQTQARITGVQLYEYNNAVRAWISQNVGAASGAKPTGTAWLKSTTCGGTSSIGYLPCTFPNMDAATPVRFGQIQISSSVATTGVTPNQTTVVTTTTTPFRVVTGSTTNLRTDLAGLAAVVAAAGGVNSLSPMLASTDGSVSSNPSTGVITMQASNNGASDAWLRTDGSNTMNSNITYKATNPASLRTLTNVSRVQALSSELLYLGQSMGWSSGQVTVVDSGLQANGNVVVANYNNSAYGIQVNQGSIYSVAGNVVAGLDVVSGRDVVASTIKANPSVSSQLLLSGSSLAFTDQSLNTNNAVPFVGYADVSQFYVKTATGNKVSLTDLLPRWVHKSSWYAFDTEGVAKPTCGAGGTPKIVVVPQSIPTNQYSPPAGYYASYRAATYAYAVDLGTYWQVRIYPAYQATTNGSAVAMTYCLY
ncbi:type II secretion system protein [Pseudomonas putida]|uniref:Type II secretion system protein n=1 Tax=Pseudomonas putida TaxID=303 RepID=A0A8I1JGN6_PSEPU|nr:type II secretion system protein [Pseudomonas putida]